MGKIHHQLHGRFSYYQVDYQSLYICVVQGSPHVYKRTTQEVFRCFFLLLTCQAFISSLDKDILSACSAPGTDSVLTRCVVGYVTQESGSSTLEQLPLRKLNKNKPVIKQSQFQRVMKGNEKLIISRYDCQHKLPQLCDHTLTNAAGFSLGGEELWCVKKDLTRVVLREQLRPHQSLQLSTRRVVNMFQIQQIL